MVPHTGQAFSGISAPQHDGSGTLRIADGGRVSPAIDMTLHGPLHIGKGGSYSHYKGCPISITVPGDCTIDEGGAVDVVGSHISSLLSAKVLCNELLN